MPGSFLFFGLTFLVLHACSSDSCGFLSWRPSSRLPLPSSALLLAKALGEELRTGAVPQLRTEEKKSVLDPFYQTAELVGAREQKGVLPAHAGLRSGQGIGFFPRRLLAVTLGVSLVLSLGGGQ